MSTGPSEMEGANRYLQDIFIPEFWQKRLTVHAKNVTSEFSLVPNELNLDAICVEKEYRKIRNDHTFSYGNQFYRIESSLKHSIAKQEIEIRKQPSGDFTVYFADRLLEISRVVEPTKPSMYDLKIQRKMDAITLAETLGNISEAARISGCSRETIYKNKRLLKEKGPLALKRTFQPDLHHKNRSDKDLEEIVIHFSLRNPHLGQAQVAAHLKTDQDIYISPSGIRNIWIRKNMNTCALRVLKSKSSLEMIS